MLGAAEIDVELAVKFVVVPRVGKQQQLQDEADVWLGVELVFVVALLVVLGLVVLGLVVLGLVVLGLEDQQWRWRQQALEQQKLELLADDDGNPDDEVAVAVSVLGLLTEPA